MRRYAVSVAWAAVAIAILALEALPSAIVSSPGSNYAFQDTYYVVANRHYGVSLVAACAVFAVAYGVLRPASKFQRRLAWAHLATFVMGCALILRPLWVVAPVIGLSRRHRDPLNVFTGANWASTIGYAITLLGLLIFIGFLADKAARALASTLGPRSG